MEGILSQCTYISNYYIVHQVYVSYSFVIFISVMLKKETAKEKVLIKVTFYRHHSCIALTLSAMKQPTHTHTHTHR